MRNAIQGADSVGSLSIELCLRFERHYRDRCACEFIHSIYLYATWCIRSPSVDVYNGAAIGFCEYVSRFAFGCDAATYQLIVHELVSNIGLPEILRMPFGYSIERHQYEAFLEDCAKADHDIRRKKQHNKSRRKQIRG